MRSPKMSSSAIHRGDQQHAGQCGDSESESKAMAQSTVQPAGPPNLLTVRQFAAKHRAFTEGSLRYLIFLAQTNGFKSAVIRLGKRVLLDEAKVFEWIERQQKRSG